MPTPHYNRWRIRNTDTKYVSSALWGYADTVCIPSAYKNCRRLIQSSVQQTFVDVFCQRRHRFDFTTGVDSSNQHQYLCFLTSALVLLTDLYRRLHCVCIGYTDTFFNLCRCFLVLGKMPISCSVTQCQESVGIIIIYIVEREFIFLLLVYLYYIGNDFQILLKRESC